MIIIMPQRDMSEIIMSRVNFVYFVRRLMYPFIAEVVIMSGAIAASVTFISFGHVMTNLESVSSLPAFFNYALSTVLNTEVNIQLSIIAGTGVSAFFVWKVFQTSKSLRGTPVQA